MAKLKMSSFPFVRSALLASVALLVLVPNAQAFERTQPAGQGYAITVPEPAARYPLPLSDTYRNQTGKNAKGEDVRAYDDRDNPVIEILSGFNRIWTLGDKKWADGGANGDLESHLLVGRPLRLPSVFRERFKDFRGRRARVTSTQGHSRVSGGKCDGFISTEQESVGIVH